MSSVLQGRRRETLSALLKVGQMEAFSPVLKKVRQIASDPNSDAQKLADIVRLDPGLTARVIKMANSSYYTLSRNRISDVRQAVVSLGFNTVKRLALTATVLEDVANDESDENMPLERFWTHSLACGLAVPIFAQRMGLGENEDFFLAGFMHDIAKPILWKYLPEKWGKVVTAIKNNADPQRAEVDVFGLTHAEIGAWLLRMWRFPDDFYMGVGTHHLDGKGGGNLGLAIIQANLIAASIMDTFPFSKRNTRVIFTQLARHGMSMDQINDLVSDVKREVIRMSKEMELKISSELTGEKEEKKEEEEEA